jgi:hypothetical protein
VEPTNGPPLAASLPEAMPEAMPEALPERRPEAMPKEELPRAVGALVNSTMWLVTVAVSVGGPAALFALCTAIADGSSEGGAIANLLFFLGAPTLFFIGIAVGRRLRRLHTKRLLQAGLDDSAPLLGQASGPGSTSVAVPAALHPTDVE